MVLLHNLFGEGGKIALVIDHFPQVWLKDLTRTVSRAKQSSVGTARSWRGEKEEVADESG